MGALRQRMIEAMKLRRFSPRTQECYVGAVAALARHYHQSPDQLDAEKIRAYLLHLTVERGLAWSSVNQAIAALRFFYLQVLGWKQVDLPIPPRKKSTHLPVVLSREELEHLFARAREGRDRMLLRTTYAAGLRLGEAIHLKVTDLDGHRGTIRVEQGKGARDRYTLLSPQLLEELRLYWKRDRPPVWLFPSRRDPRRCRSPPSSHELPSPCVDRLRETAIRFTIPIEGVNFLPVHRGSVQPGFIHHAPIIFLVLVFILLGILDKTLFVGSLRFLMLTSSKQSERRSPWEESIGRECSFAEL